MMTGVLVSFYLFPIGLTFLPASVNTKMLMAVAGVGLAGLYLINKREITVSRPLLGAIGFAFVFSLICFYSVDYNHTNDYAYATYFSSFFTWLGGAYAVCWAIRKVHGEVDFKRLTFYLAGVCFAQCVLAIMIDRIPAFQLLVDRYIAQGQEFFQEVDRLYGIGAALDPAGVRFSLVLIMIVALLSKHVEVRSDRRSIILLLIAFFSITVIGNMISRTTIIGLLLSIGYLLLSTGLLRFVLKKEHAKFLRIFGLMLFCFIGISVYLYHTDVAFYDNMRFAFEGFFNWVEKGEWKTDSTDKLNNEMWIWPSDLQTWLIGSGLFNNYVYSTDIGYCRFILYCGLVGFGVFALFFVYNAYVFGAAYPRYGMMFFLFLILTFVVWIKVATDIFVIYALFYCLDSPKFQRKPI
ncbi:hypothetical protein GCM10011418_45450 [Sphingobacterium alkalisoli]|nr:hypothetical protein [Sphingobacterium alkalisoli]GGH32131.1 hypothetical protein GCM10011418_45450 [Sphingobacterium alkalisoli]